jgi:hypothetical protein
MKEQWTYNSDNDYWDNEVYDSKELAIEAGRENLKSDEPDFFYESSHFRVGKVTPLAMRSIDASEMLLENISDNLYDDHEQAGENAFTKVTNEQILDLEKQLQTVFDNWIKKYDCDPTKGYFTVSDVEDVPFSTEHL